MSTRSGDIESLVGNDGGPQQRRHGQAQLQPTNRIRRHPALRLAEHRQQAEIACVVAEPCLHNAARPRPSGKSLQVGRNSPIVEVKVCAICAFWIAAALPAAALTLYWDADANPANNNVDGTGLGGAGSWNGAGFWWDGSSTTNQNWSDNSDVILSGTAGRIQLGGTNVVAASLQMSTAGYTIDLCITNAGTTAYNLTVNGISGLSGSVVNSSGNTTKAFTIAIASGVQTSGVRNHRFASSPEIFTFLDHVCRPRF